MQSEGHLTSLIDSYVENRGREFPSSGYLFKPSSIYKCPREIYYNIVNPDLADKVEGRIIRIADNGSYAHERIQKYLVKMGMLYSDKWLCNCGYSNNVEKGYSNDNICKDCGREVKDYTEIIVKDDFMSIYGKCDGVLEDDGEFYLFEFKTISTRDFSSMKSAKPDHILQVQLYLYLTGFKKALVMYEDRNSFLTKEFIINYDQEVIDMLLVKMRYIKECLDKKTPPKRWCTSNKSRVGIYCPYKDSICFKNTIKKDEIENIEPINYEEYDELFYNEREDYKCF